MPRKQHTHHYIYKTTCKVNGKYYVGMHSTSNLKDGYIGSGKRLWNSIRKHGRENHEIEILEWFLDRSSLKERERELVNESLLQDPLCMNLKCGGEGGLVDENHKRKWMAAGRKKLWEDILFRKRKSESLRDLNKERWKSEGFRKKMSEISKCTWTGRNHNQETKEKISRSMTLQCSGEKNSQFGTVWICKNEEIKKIRKEELLFHIENGWKRGRKWKSD